MAAACAQNKEILKLIIESQGDVNALDEGGNSPLHMAAGVDGKEETLPDNFKLLLEQGAFPKLKNNGGKTAMEVATAHGIDYDSILKEIEDNEKMALKTKLELEFVSANTGLPDNINFIIANYIDYIRPNYQKIRDLDKVFYKAKEDIILINNGRANLIQYW